MVISLLYTAYHVLFFYKLDFHDKHVLNKTTFIFLISFQVDFFESIKADTSDNLLWLHLVTQRLGVVLMR